MARVSAQSGSGCFLAPSRHGGKLASLGFSERLSWIRSRRAHVGSHPAAAPTVASVTAAPSSVAGSRGSQCTELHACPSLARERCDEAGGWIRAVCLVAMDIILTTAFPTDVKAPHS